VSPPTREGASRKRLPKKAAAATPQARGNFSTPTRRWCRCQRELHELLQFRATRGISIPYYGGIYARAHAEGRCA
jgi:hypothetical protein